MSRTYRDTRRAAAVERRACRLARAARRVWRHAFDSFDRATLAAVNDYNRDAAHGRARVDRW